MIRNKIVSLAVGAGFSHWPKLEKLVRIKISIIYILIQEPILASDMPSCFQQATREQGTTKFCMNNIFYFQ